MPKSHIFGPELQRTGHWAGAGAIVRKGRATIAHSKLTLLNDVHRKKMAKQWQSEDDSKIFRFVNLWNRLAPIQMGGKLGIWMKLIYF